MATLEQLIIFFLLLALVSLLVKWELLLQETRPNSHLLFLTLRCQPLYFPVLQLNSHIFPEKIFPSYLHPHSLRLFY